MTDYGLLYRQLEGFAEAEPFFVPLFANASALLYETLEGINWAGFYFMRGGALVLGPFQGKPACITIPVGRGVCGTAALLGRTVRVDDVHEFSGHIPCDSASRSEIVVPIMRDGKPSAVLDIDSPLLSRFTPADERGLEAFAQLLEAHMTLE